MPSITYPNQKKVCIHREIPKTDFLGIKNENWQAAARDLRPFSLALYLYLASNADNYTLALSPAAVEEAIGMKRSTFSDQLKNLIQRGYLVHSHGNTYDFYEMPQPRAVIKKNETSLVNNFEDDGSTAVDDMTVAVKTCPSESIEINNSENVINNKITNIEFPSRIEAPKVREIVIKTPKAEGKLRAQMNEPKHNTFVF